MERAGAAPGGGLRVVAGFLAPGKVVGDGRYRLLAQVGIDEGENAHLWRARDGQLDRDVALTVLIGQLNDAGVITRIRRTLDRCVRLGGIAYPGVAQVLNVLTVGDGIRASEGIAGLVVAEWTPGTDLVDLAASRPPFAAICQALDPLAAAVEHAHHRAVVLGIGHPRRLRLTPEGALRLAFPCPPADASLVDDVRGLGATLYLLLTGRWPEAGAIPPPQALRPEVPGKLSDLAVHSLDTNAPRRIRTAATIRQTLRQAVDDAERTDQLPPVPAEPPEPADGPIWVTKRPVKDPARNRVLAIAVTALIVASLTVVAWIGLTMADLVNGSNPKAGGPSVSVTSPAPPAPTSEAPPPNLAPQPAIAVAPDRIEVFNISGDADGANKADRAVDGDSATSWRTNAYLRQFPAFKPGIGIGLLVSFPNPVTLTKVGIVSPSAGTQVEIRTAPSPTPRLADTTVIGTATLTDGTTTIDLHQQKPTQYVLIWITQLARVDQHFQSAFDELVFTAS